MGTRGCPCDRPTGTSKELPMPSYTRIGSNAGACEATVEGAEWISG